MNPPPPTSDIITETNPSTKPVGALLDSHPRHQQQSSSTQTRVDHDSVLSTARPGANLFQISIGAAAAE
ncbi:hypothetical protein C2S51_028350 [Perilla frutescens var. frutescens]|nr:hypothetical protein C2S51_028350 [Perilla frutescens var. frutescens]